MLTMTDYINSGIIQEQNEFEDCSNEQVMEQFMSLQASFANIERVLEFQTIMEFCTSESIEVPSIIQEGEILDTIGSFFDNLVDWLCGIVRSIVGSINKIRLGKIITGLEHLDSDGKNVKVPKGVIASAAFIESALTIFDDLAEIINRIELNNEIKTNRSALIRDLETFIGNAGPTITKYNKLCEKAKAQGNTVIIKLEGNDVNVSEIKVGTHTDKADSSAKDGDLDLRSVIDELKKIHSLDIPKTGRKILKKLKFDKSKTVDSDGKKDREVIRLVRKAANKVATYYDVFYRDVIFYAEKFAKDNDIKVDSMSGYKADTEFKGRTGRDQSNPLGSATKAFRATNNTAEKVLK